MKKQVFNPFLPNWEYIPDGEPRVFGDRVYLYGSHDRFNAHIFCVNDYVCYSAPIDDLTSWRFEGVIYKKNQDPKNRLGLHLLFAPDVVQGPDGHYYLYYSFDFTGIIGVAVCDTPAGKFKYYGCVRYKDGTKWGRKKGDQFPFDPGVLVDNDNVYLYSGFGLKVPSIYTGGKQLKNDGGVVVQLEKDMITIKNEPKVLFPLKGEGSFFNHEFFEASSIRKYGDDYIFVYSSKHNHELCYAISKSPDKDFTFGGTLVSLGDLPLHDKPVNYLGNTHGGLLYINNRYYIFYHRQTNRHSYSRQACAEEVIRKSDGSFIQAVVTSCGLNDGPLLAEGKYNASIVCNLWSKYGTGRYDIKNTRKIFSDHPYITQSGKDKEERESQYIANMQQGSVAGFKYFSFNNTSIININIRGKGIGTVLVSEKEDFSEINGIIHIELDSKKADKTFGALLRINNGTKPLYFKYEGTGYIDLIGFELK